MVSAVGIHVAEIANQTVSAGSWTFHWDGTSNSGNTVPSGQYFIVVESDNFQHWLKAILLK